MDIRSIALLLAFILLVFPACDALSPNDEPTGQLELRLTDDPFPYDLINEAHVTISQVEILSAGVENVVVMTSEEHEDINLLELQDDVSMLLGSRELPADTYTQIRMYIDDASVVMNDDESTVYDLDVPSSAQSGLHIPLGNYEIEENEEHDLTLDFDVEESFLVQGDPHSHESIEGFIFQPVVRPVGIEPPAPPEPTVAN